MQTIIDLAVLIVSIYIIISFIGISIVSIWSIFVYTRDYIKQRG